MRIPQDRLRVRVIRRASLALAVFASVWTAGLVLSGGFDANVFGTTISSHEPLRPFVIACLAVAVFVLVGGRVPSGFQAVTRWRVSERAQAVALSLAVTGFGITYATTVGVGSDGYGYVSQADLWLAGDLRVDQPWVAEAPWPSSRWSFTPLGYRPHGAGSSIVPTYSPGLALLMAGAKAVGGQEALFWVVPLLGGVFVLATYGVARRVAPPGVAIVATWLIASCPAMLYMLVQPMSDVPVAAAWMTVCYFLLRPGVPAGLAAGLAAGGAVLIRPNLAFLAMIFVMWPMVQAARTRDGRSRALWQVVAFGACVCLAAIAVGLINRQLYGAPLTSGYGDMSVLFDRSHLWPNLVRYGSWLIESQTIVAAAGAAALFLPWRRIWPDVDHRRFLGISASVVASIWLLYSSYLVFDAWWYLRFMLPALPFIAIGTAAIAVAVRRAGGRITSTIVAIVLVLVVITQYRFAVNHGVLDFWRGERRYVSVGRLVGAHTDEHSVIFSIQHSGSLRYYGGRTTIRFDNLAAESLDEAIAWLSSRGIRSYLLAEEWEIPMFRERFAGQDALARLDTPLVVYRAPAVTTLYDLARVADHEPLEFEVPLTGLRSMRPVPIPQLKVR